MDVTPRELLRRRIQERLLALSEKEQSEECEVLITDLFQLFLDLDEESQKLPMYTIPPSISPWPPTTFYPTWEPVPDSTIPPSYPWWDSRNPFKITTMTTNTATIPTGFAMSYETPGYDTADEDILPADAGEDFDEGEPVPA